MSYIIISGNIIDGSAVFGPFDTGSDAVEWADRQLNNAWIVAELYDPADNTENAQ